MSLAVFNPVPLAAIIGSAAWYLWSARRLTATGKSWPRWRTAAFVAADIVLAVAFLSGVDDDSRHFALHAVQQVLIAMAAPIGFAASAPITLAIQCSGATRAAAILKALRSGPARFATHPVFTWAAYGLSVSLLYFTNLYAFTRHDSVVRGLMLADLILVGCLFWWPVVSSDPLPNPLGYWRKMAYLLLAMPFHTIVGMSIESQTSTIAKGIGLNDLHLGGGIIWVAGEAAGLLGTIAVFLQWLRADEKAALDRDAQSGPTARRQLAHWQEVRDAARAAGRVPS